MLDSSLFIPFILFYPAGGFFIGLFFGRFLATEDLYLLLVLHLACSLFFCCCGLFYIFSQSQAPSLFLVLGTWVTFGRYSVEWTFLLDPLSCIMSFVIVSISLVIHIFSFYYMEQDPNSKKFVLYLSLFTFFMLFLVLSGNFLVLFVGWEGVGIASYLLIGFWHTRAECVRSALKALLINRIGDLSLLLMMALLYSISGTLDFQYAASFFSLWAKSAFLNGSQLHAADLFCILLIIAAAAKSAQFFFHTWLVDAMEGPTPVSALLHSATMVTAGVYLVLRCSFIFQYSYLGSFLLLFIGSVTAIFSGLVACYQWDIKKIIAYSTCSQLGLMFVACGSLNYKAALFHLVTHAYSKALLFILAGLIIHSFSGEQDIRKMGGGSVLFPYVYILFLFANFSLMGFPFTSGFYSKELIINEFLNSNFGHGTGFIALLFLFFSTFVTCAYSFRLIYYVFWRSYSGTYNILTRVNLDMPLTLSATLLFLFFLSFFIGWLFLFYFNNEILFFSKTLTPSPSWHILAYGFELMNVVWAFLIVFTAVFLIFFYYFSGDFFERKPLTVDEDLGLVGFFVQLRAIFYNASSRGFYFDYVYNYLSLFFLHLTFLLHAFFEAGLLKLFGPRKAYFILEKVSYYTQRLHTGRVSDYVSNNVFFILIFFLIVLYWGLS